VEEAHLDRAFGLANRYGVLFVLVGRSIPVLRSAVSLTAGMSKMPLPTFLLLSGLNSLVITGIWIFIGYWLGENWREALRFISDFEPIITVVLAVAVVALVGWWLAKRIGWVKGRQAQMPAPLPTPTQES
jgi:membrane protein DedA with SNARE-associated domain